MLTGSLGKVHDKIDQTCEKHLRFWLIGIAFIFFIHTIRNCLLIAIWKASKKPREHEQMLNLLYLSMFLTPELVWYGYGSLMIFSDSMTSCKNLTEETEKSLMYSAYTLLIYSYAVFILIIMAIILFLMAYIIFKRTAKSNQKTTRENNILF